MSQSRSNKSQWSNQEIDLIKQLYPRYVSKKWKNISKIFKKKGFVRTQSDCRQKWINFIDPKINLEEWTDQQLTTLYQNYQKFGSRWSLVQKKLKGRTQNKIKNRFYGTLRNMIRFVLQKYNKEGPSYSLFISKLSPLTLNAFYKGVDDFSFLKDEVRQAVKYMKYNMNKGLLNLRIRANRQLYSNLNNQMMKIFQKIKNKEDQDEELFSGQRQQQQFAINQGNRQQYQGKQVSEYIRNNTQIVQLNNMGLQNNQMYMIPNTQNHYQNEVNFGGLSSSTYNMQGNYNPSFANSSGFSYPYPYFYTYCQNQGEEYLQQYKNYQQ